jgi:8-oxo-dGTP pyrophosphatase MutT (NUDIX family)
MINDQIHVCLISTHNGVYGFPKGKRNKGENVITAALRELEEETGIRSNQITQLESNTYIDEGSSRNTTNVSIRLFITQILDPNIILTPKDLDEISTCQFYTIDNAMSLLNPKRKDVLTKALSIFKTSSNN